MAEKELLKDKSVTLNVGIERFRDIKLLKSEAQILKSLEKKIGIRFSYSNELRLSYADVLNHLQFSTYQGRIMGLSLINCGLKEIPFELSSLTSLRYLNLGKNSIKKIENLDSLTDLKIFCISENYIEKIENLKSLLNLEELILHDNYIRKISEMHSLTYLKYLRLGNNFIEEISGLGKLQSLEALSLAKNNIVEMKGIEKLKNLKKLWLSKNKITKIEGLEDFNSLQTIRLDNNCISTDLLGSLERLKGSGFLDPKKVVAYCVKHSKRCE